MLFVGFCVCVGGWCVFGDYCGLFDVVFGGVGLWFCLVVSGGLCVGRCFGWDW